MPVAVTPDTYTLHETERAEFHRLGRELGNRINTATGQSRVDTSAVPAELRRFLGRFAECPSDRGFALVRGILIDPPPPTPNVHTSGLLNDHPTAGNLMLVADLLGSLFGYADEKNGTLVHDVHPVRGEENRMENSGSVDFGAHTENAHHPVRPDFLGLLCLRQDHDRLGTLRLSSVRDAVRELPEHTVDVLRRPRFRCLYPTSFTRAGNGVRPSSAPHPVITGDAPEFLMRYDSGNTRALDAEADSALRAFGAALDACWHQVLLEPGDLAIIDNRVTAHGRSAFRPRYDGQDRWLRRFYALRSVAPWARPLLRNRVLPPMADVLRAHDTAAVAFGA